MISMWIPLKINLNINIMDLFMKKH
jgi:hypothetical protein